MDFDFRGVSEERLLLDAVAEVAAESLGRHVNVLEMTITDLVLVDHTIELRHLNCGLEDEPPQVELPGLQFLVEDFRDE